jgi:hypothetical protein
MIFEISIKINRRKLLIKTRDNAYISLLSSFGHVGEFLIAFQKFVVDLRDAINSGMHKNVRKIRLNLSQNI